MDNITQQIAIKTQQMAQLKDIQDAIATRKQEKIDALKKEIDDLTAKKNAKK
jgi:hypothetical protein